MPNFEQSWYKTLKHLMLLKYDELINRPSKSSCIISGLIQYNQTGIYLFKVWLGSVGFECNSFKLYSLPFIAKSFCDNKIYNEINNSQML